MSIEARAATDPSSATPVLNSVETKSPAISSSGSDKTHAIYFDALGKGGLWGMGYDQVFSERFAFGSVASYYSLDGERIFSLSPYLSYYPLLKGHNRWLVQVGPQFLSQTTVSPVPEWTGMTSSRFGGEISSGYEYRDHFLFRVYGMISMGGGGIAPWLGTSVGLAF
jgi:hypothetical protein